MDSQENTTYFAETDYRNQNKRFGIKQPDRTRHMYIVGKTGMGKSTLLANMAAQDIQGGNGMAIIDPHGSLADLLLDYVPADRVKDVLYFAPFDLEYPISFNVMEDVGSDRRHLVSNGLMSAFKKIWVDMWSARMEYILNNILLALLEYPGSTIIGVNRMLADKDYRKNVVSRVTDVSVKSFWEDEFAKYSERFMTEAGASIQNKIGQFISNPVVRNIIGQPKSSFDLRELMDERKILIINLSKGRVGEDNANLIGSMFITKLYLAAMSRADLSGHELGKLPNFYLFVDEFQSFANESFADILSEARKYKLNLTIAHQYIAQMTEPVRDAVFGNVGTMVAFRVGAFDAETLEKEFAPTFTKTDLVNLGFAQIYLKLMIDGVTSHPFSARTLGPIPEMEHSHREEIIRHSREQYAAPRAKVEDDLIKWHQSPAGLTIPLESDSSGREPAPAPQQREQTNKQNHREQPKKQHQQNRREQHQSGSDRQLAPDREKELHQAISLRQLQNKDDEKTAEEKRAEKKNRSDKRARDKERNVNKDATPEHVNQLRDALQSVLAQAQKTADNQKKEEEKEHTKQSAPEQPSFEPNEQSKQKDKSQQDINDEIAPHEIPRDVLEKLLEVE